MQPVGHLRRRFRYVSFFLALWLIYLLVNHSSVQTYVNSVHDALLQYGFVAAPLIGALLRWAFFLLLAAVFAVQYGESIGSYLTNKAQAWMPKQVQGSSQQSGSRPAASASAVKGRSQPASSPSASSQLLPSASESLQLKQGEHKHKQQQCHAGWLQQMQAANEISATQAQTQAKQAHVQALKAEIDRKRQQKAQREDEMRRMIESERKEATKREEDERQLNRDWEQAQMGLIQARELRAEQDREYRESLEHDQRLQSQWEAEAAAQEAERQQRQVQQQQKQDDLLQLRKLKQQLRAQLKEQPGTNATRAVSVRVRLPQGSSHTRRFLEDTPLQDVKDWVQSLEDFPPWQPQQWQLVNSFPKVVLDRGCNLGSMAEGCPRISLFVENLEANSPA